jgi:hypothetical protein
MMRLPLTEEGRVVSVDWGVDFILFEFLFRERVDFFADSEIVLSDFVVVGSGVLGSLGAG